jgi:hypothetical protein
LHLQKQLRNNNRTPLVKCSRFETSTRWRSNSCISGPGDCSGSGTWTVYDNFPLSAATILTGFTNWNYAVGTTTYGSTTWSLWSNNPALGNNPLFSGNSVGTMAVDNGTFKVTVANLAVQLAAGNYWLGINQVITGNSPWTYATGAQSLQDAIQKDGGVNTFTAQQGMAFTLDGTAVNVPEPATLPLMLGTLGLMAFVMKARRKQF